MLEINPDLMRVQDNNGDTVLHYAVQAGFEDVIELLIERDNQLINIKNKKGETALHVAAGLRNTWVGNLGGGYLWIIVYMFKKFPKLINEKNINGETAKDILKKNFRFEAPRNYDYIRSKLPNLLDTCSP
jgi:ankyrin repeat protein